MLHFQVINLLDAVLREFSADGAQDTHLKASQHVLHARQLLIACAQLRPSRGRLHGNATCAIVSKHRAGAGAAL